MRERRESNYYYQGVRDCKAGRHPDSKMCPRCRQHFQYMAGYRDQQAQPNEVRDADSRLH